MKKVEIKIKNLDVIEKLVMKERQNVEESKRKLQEEKIQFFNQK